MDALYILLFFVAVNAAKFYVTILQGRRVKLKATELRREVYDLRLAAKDLESPATFAKSAKLERQANAKERDIADLLVPPPNQIQLQKGVNTIKYLVCAALMYQWWSIPVMFIAAERLGFMANFQQALQSSWKEEDGEVKISITSWMLLCEGAANSIISALDVAAW